MDVAYVGNRGAWWLSSILDNYNALTPQILTANGLDINNATDRAILRAQIGSTAAGRFQNKLPYAGFPLTSTVAQALRPYPQFSSGLAPLWAPQGRTWYDSLQMKVTKRYSHGLIVDYAFTWAKEEQLGVEAGHGQRFSKPHAEQDHFRILPPAGERDFGQLRRSHSDMVICAEQSRLAGSPWLDYRHGAELCQRPAHSGAHVDQQSEYAVVPLDLLQPRAGRAALPHRFELPLHRSHQTTGAESGGVESTRPTASGALRRLITTITGISGAPPSR